MSLSLDFRELTSTVSLTSSWDDLSLHDEPMVTDVKRPKSFNEPLHIFTSPMAYSSSPSPTRLAKVYKSTAVVISYYYRPQRSWGKVIFSEVCVKYSVHGGGACMAGGMRGRGRAWWGACMVRGHARKGVCVAGGVQGRGACVADTMRYSQ